MAHPPAPPHLPNPPLPQPILQALLPVAQLQQIQHRGTLTNYLQSRPTDDSVARSTRGQREYGELVALYNLPQHMPAAPLEHHAYALRDLRFESDVVQPGRSGFHKYTDSFFYVGKGDGVREMVHFTAANYAMRFGINMADNLQREQLMRKVQGALPQVVARIVECWRQGGQIAVAELHANTQEKIAFDCEMAVMETIGYGPNERLLNIAPEQSELYQHWMHNNTAAQTRDKHRNLGIHLLKSSYARAPSQITMRYNP